MFFNISPDFNQGEITIHALREEEATVDEKIIYGCLAFFCICCLAVKVLAPKTKGLLGEKKVAGVLRRLPEGNYRVINHVLLRRRQGNTVQIDHVVVSVYGIFVIETKNFSGLIVGNDFSEQWVKYMYRRSYPFFSPTRQNYGHIRALEELLELPRDSFISIVVFLPGARLRVRSRVPVIHTKQLNKTIRSYKTEKLDRAQVRAVESRIRSLNIYSKKAMKKHVKSVKKQSRRHGGGFWG